VDGFGVLELAHEVYRRGFAGLVRAMVEGTDPRDDPDVAKILRWHALCEANIAAEKAEQDRKAREQVESLNRPPPGYEGFTLQERDAFGQLIGPSGETYVPRWSEIGRR
jgi:hypothetical protein